MVSGRKFSWNCFKNNSIFFSFAAHFKSSSPTTSRELRQQFAACSGCKNEMNRALGENLLRMVRWMRWHFPPDTGFEIRALAVWGRARYLSVTEAPHNTEFYTWMGKKHFCFFQTAETGSRTRTPAWKAAVLTTTLGPPPVVDVDDNGLLTLSLHRWNMFV